MTRLIYRGIEYEPHGNKLDILPSHAGGKYRGQLWRKNVLRMMPIDTRDIDLQYRGIKYHLGFEKEPLTRLIHQVDACTSHKPSEMLKCAHLNNIRCNIEHRLQVAKSKGDDALVGMLLDEARQLAT